MSPREFGKCHGAHVAPARQVMAASKDREFHHPYTPYDIQNDLMNAVYECIDGRKIGIFESPTGTGKSLSLICSSLTWLRDHQGQLVSAINEESSDKGNPSWVREHTHDQRSRALKQQKTAFEARLQQIRARELQQKQTYEKQPAGKRRKKSRLEASTDKDEETNFELEEYESGNEETNTKSAAGRPETGVSSASLSLMEQLGLVLKPAEDDELLPVDEVKVFYCSRTHSQLTQFVQEVKRVKLPAPTWAISDMTESDKESEAIVVKHLPLGSRKNLCINQEVSNLSNVTAINERCLELQQSGASKERKCDFLPTKENQNLVNDFRDHTLASIRDIEEVGNLGRKLGICPYYASRSSIKPSEIVTLPYPLMLQKSAREALDISLKGHVIIIDEAHNLVDTISNIHSVSISQKQLKKCRASVGVYLQKYRNRLKGKNRVYIAQLVRLLDSLSNYLETKSFTKASTDGVAVIEEIMAGKGVDSINLYKLATYLQHSKLARKVEGYIQHEEQIKLNSQANRDGFQARPSAMPVLTQFQSFLQTLANPAAEGRFFYEKGDGGEILLRYMLLDPTYHFRDIVEEARAVILAGGTMSPMEDYARHLLAYVDPERIKTWSCDHIIPKENLVVMPIVKAVDGTSFDFTYEKRNAPQLIKALGDSLVAIATKVPHGVVVFFPSYAYLDRVVAEWKQNIATKIPLESIWDQLLATKPIFQESKATSVEDMLISYSISVSTGRGGLLLSVINGKLSEGINFSDALGRAVIVVGLPFPNIQSAQWRTKLEYIEQSTTRRNDGNVREGKDASRDFYENACMRAVNQSIGRAIRHRGDYAAILLLDRRYAGGRIEEKLPAWIRQRLIRQSPGEGFCDVTRRLSDFFTAKEARK